MNDYYHLYEPELDKFVGFEAEANPRLEGGKVIWIDESFNSPWFEECNLIVAMSIVEQNRAVGRRNGLMSAPVMSGKINGCQVLTALVNQLIIHEPELWAFSTRGSVNDMWPLTELLD